MFNLVKKRYLFLLISLVVIVPGTISLIIFHLDVGIDFAGGATVELRPNAPISTANVSKALKPLNLQNLAILTGNNTALKADQFIWVRLNTQVDGSVQQTIITDLQNKYGKSLSVDPENLTYAGKTVTVVTITNFPAKVVPTTADIQQVLKNLPKTTSPGSSGSTGAGATPTAAPVVGVTPTATPNAKATATATCERRNRDANNYPYASHNADGKPTSHYPCLYC